MPDLSLAERILAALPPAGEGRKAWRLADEMGVPREEVAACLPKLAHDGRITTAKGSISLTPGPVAGGTQIDGAQPPGETEPQLVSAPAREEAARQFEQGVLDLLPFDGKVRNWGTFKALGYSQQDFEARLAPMINDERVEKVRRGWRRGPRARLPVNLSPGASVVLAEVPADETISGARLRGEVELGDEAYRAAIDELKARGLIQVAPGPGGIFSRPAEVGPAPVPATKSRRPETGLAAMESDLYTPFLSWLESSWSGREGVIFSHSRITGSPQGWPLRTGRWSRPDVITVQVTMFEWLRVRAVEVGTYEIKRWADRERREIVYETAAHGRWAHRANLVVEVPPGDGEWPDLSELIMEEADRFGLGLYLLRRRGDGRYVAHLLFEGKPQKPEPEKTNAFLAQYLGANPEASQGFKAVAGGF